MSLLYVDNQDAPLAVAHAAPIIELFVRKHDCQYTVDEIERAIIEDKLHLITEIDDNDQFLKATGIYIVYISNDYINNTSSLVVFGACSVTNDFLSRTAPRIAEIAKQLDCDYVEFVSSRPGFDKQIQPGKPLHGYRAIHTTYRLEV